MDSSVIVILEVRIPGRVICMIGHPVVRWPQTGNAADFLGGSRSKVSVPRTTGGESAWTQRNSVKKTHGNWPTRSINRDNALFLRDSGRTIDRTETCPSAICVSFQYGASVINFDTKQWRYLKVHTCAKNILEMSNLPKKIVINFTSLAYSIKQSLWKTFANRLFIHANRLHLLWEQSKMHSSISVEVL
jgi:hypothetical protein